MIEKLRITPGPWYPGDRAVKTTSQTCKEEHIVCVQPSEELAPNSVKYWDKSKLLIAAAPEMLEALIESLMKAEELNSIIIEFDQDMLNDIYKQDKRVVAVEKATGKTWQEIKKLLEDK